MGRFGLVVAALGMVATPLTAQNECSGVPTGNPQKACQTAADAVKEFHPLAGLIVSGGNPVLGTAGTLGGLGHVSVSARFNAVKVALPNPDSATQNSVPAGTSPVVPAPVVEGGLGLFRGMEGGLLALDVLGSATLLPTTQVAGLSVDSNATKIGSVALGLGYGVRVGVLKGFFPVPSVSVSVMRRTLPRIKYGTLAPTLGAGNQFEFDSDLKATNVRVGASMKFVLLDVGAGVGFDKYTSTAHIRFHDNPLVPTSVKTVTLDLDNSRQLLFANAGLDFAVVKLVAEIGYQTGKDQQLKTNFTGFDPTAGHVFGGAGLRLSF